MAEKIPFFTFFESFVPPRELRLLLHDARVVGGLLDRENRSMELELESGEEFSEAARSALEQLLQKEYDLRRLTLHIRSAAQAAAKVSNDVLFGKEIKGKTVSMESLNPKMGGVVVEGKVFASECYETRRPGVWCLTFDMTDNCNSITVRKYLQDKEHTLKLMKKHAAIIGPKFHAVLDALEKEIEPLEIASWCKPKGGYFVSLNAMPGTAKRTHALCKEAGVTMTGAGATFPYGKDPQDSNIRSAPTLPSVEELEKAIDVFCVCLKMAALEKLGV